MKHKSHQTVTIDQKGRGPHKTHEQSENVLPATDRSESQQKCARQAVLSSVSEEIRNEILSGKVVVRVRTGRQNSPEEVKFVQDEINTIRNRMGQAVLEFQTSRFDREEKKAVKSLQRSLRVSSDGEWGTITQAKVDLIGGRLDQAEYRKLVVIAERRNAVRREKLSFSLSPIQKDSQNSVESKPAEPKEEKVRTQEQPGLEIPKRSIGERMKEGIQAPLRVLQDLLKKRE